MVKVIQGCLVVAGLVVAFGAGYQLKPMKPVAKVAPVSTPTPVIDDVPAFSPATDIQMPTKELTPPTAVEVNRQDVTYKFIEKELGIQTKVVDTKELNTLEVLQPIKDAPSAP